MDVIVSRLATGDTAALVADEAAKPEPEASILDKSEDQQAEPDQEEASICGAEVRPQLKTSLATPPVARQLLRSSCPPLQQLQLQPLLLELRQPQ